MRFSTDPHPERDALNPQQTDIAQISELAAFARKRLRLTI